MELQQLVTCNCSICSKMGWMLAFVPASSFELQSGEAQLADYQFGKKHVHHLFCKKCGIRSFTKGVGPDGVEMISVNVRCLDGVDASNLEAVQYDGASM